ncbi:hypothetical protein M2189_007059 [Bradyrhizobium japonicum]|nr:hypothetical protein [Bradyrhizobium japonicum]MCS3963856.1 hypothetical protein [Bradyrhizobium japonicum]MCS3996169.1 hypothetical protein [Bradyrhizobium japonicum]
MPVRMRKDRRRTTAGLEEWRSALETEFDFEGDLRDAGILTDEYGRPNREEARGAWKIYGAQIMAERDPRMGPAWGLREFGPPH